MSVIIAGERSGVGNTTVTPALLASFTPLRSPPHPHLLTALNRAKS